MTTIEMIQTHMADYYAEHGGYDDILDEMEQLAIEYEDIEYLGEFRGEEAKWGSRDHHVYKLADGSLVGVQYYKGAGSQESFFEGNVVALKVEMVERYVPA